MSRCNAQSFCGFRVIFEIIVQYLKFDFHKMDNIGEIILCQVGFLILSKKWGGAERRKIILAINGKKFERQFSFWIESELDRMKIGYSTFAKEIDFSGGARSFRDIRSKEKDAHRKWTLDDIIKIANYFNESPSIILAKVELFSKIYDNSHLK